jgi:hypothetical protein
MAAFCGDNHLSMSTKHTRGSGSRLGHLAGLALVACVSPPQPSPGVENVRGPGDALAVEVVAAEHMLAEHSDLRVLITRAFADSFSSPGYAGTPQRDSARTADLAQRLNARTRIASADPWELPDTTAFLISSEPVIHGDTATITITTYWRRGPPSRLNGGYLTQALTLARGVGGWRVIRAKDLGGT